MFHAKSFQNFLQISLHPVLSNYVTSVFYEFRLLRDVDQQEYESNILDNENEDQELKQFSDDEGSRAELGKRWAIYKPLLQAQEYMKKTQYDISVLSQAFTRFPVLKSLHISSEFGTHERASEEMYHAFGGSLAIPGMMLEGGEVDDDEQVGVRALNSVLLSASGIPKKLENLKAHRVHWSFFNPPPAAINLHQQIFTYLRHLDLTLEADYDDIDEEHAVLARHAEFGKALRAAAGLETLRLNFGDNDISPDTVLMQRGMNVPVIWEELVKDMTWKNLKSLELHFVTASESCMTDFLARHAKTLKVIKWTNMWLLDSEEGWEPIWRNMKYLMKFEAVEFGGIWGAEGENITSPAIDNMDKLGRGFAREILKGKEKEVRRRRSASDSLLLIKRTPLSKPVPTPTYEGFDMDRFEESAAADEAAKEALRL
jgi:hypothetical protein